MSPDFTSLVERMIVPSALCCSRGAKFAATVTHLAGKQPGKTVEVALALVVKHVAAFAADDHGNFVAGLIASVRGETHPQMVSRHFFDMTVGHD